jgi:hypothetical protein
MDKKLDTIITMVNDNYKEIIAVKEKLSKIESVTLSSSDNVISTIKENIIIEQLKTKQQFDEIKQLLTQQNNMLNNTITGVNSSFVTQLESVRKELRDMKTNNLNSPRMNHVSPKFNNPYLNIENEQHYRIPQFSNPFSNEEKSSPMHKSTTFLNNQTFASNNMEHSDKPPCNYNNYREDTGNHIPNNQLNTGGNNIGGTRARTVVNSTLDFNLLNKLLPPLKDWPTFEGKGDYDHISFIKYLDHILRTYNAPDEVVTSRLPGLFKGGAREWFIEKTETLGVQTWETWKELIKAKYGTRLWEKKMRRLL